MEAKLKRSLFTLRVGVFIVMIMWTIDKFVNPNHASKVFSFYYRLDGLSQSISYILGALQLILVLVFSLELKRDLPMVLF